MTGSISLEFLEFLGDLRDTNVFSLDVFRDLALLNSIRCEVPLLAFCRQNYTIAWTPWS